MGDGEGEGTEKAKWDDRNTKIFLKVCVEEVLAGNRPHSHFTKDG
ncbi:L10-interacting MYB domain-containing protein [Senna tora]|uniref:L10-interacting MYB domain-containing protein n=1 Tax=Senna tora TaxID=362788 RepID=A0A835C861_9FABA|nr:L10-interacting MYB domain-containing protein [Senna tora]